MSIINITNIVVKGNPARFLDPFQFAITFECLKDLPGEIEWRILYIGSAKDQKYDQVLDSFTVGPFQYGVMQFDVETNPPDWTKIPQEDLLGVTAILISALYKGKEFFRAGYYVYNSIPEVENEMEMMGITNEQIIQQQEQFQLQTGNINMNIPQPLFNKPIDITKVQRNILADKPRIMRYDVDWDQDTTIYNILGTTNVLNTAPLTNNQNMLNIGGGGEGRDDLYGIQFKGFFSGCTSILDNEKNNMNENSGMMFMMNNNTNVFPPSMFAQQQQIVYTGDMGLMQPTNNENIYIGMNNQ